MYDFYAFCIYILFQEKKNLMPPRGMVGWERKSEGRWDGNKGRMLVEGQKRGAGEAEGSPVPLSITEAWDRHLLFFLGRSP